MNEFRKAVLGVIGIGLILVLVFVGTLLIVGLGAGGYEWVLYIVGIAVILVIDRLYERKNKPSMPAKIKKAKIVWCNLCNRNVTPEKKFNWLIFLFLWPYLLYYLIVIKPVCPVCQQKNLSPVNDLELGKK